MPSTLRMIPEISFKTDRITFGFFENICVQGSVVVVEVATRLLRLCYTMCQLHCKRRAKFNPKVGRLDGKILNGSTASTVSIHGTATRGSKETRGSNGYKGTATSKVKTKECVGRIVGSSSRLDCFAIWIPRRCAHGDLFVDPVLRRPRFSWTPF